MATAKITTRLTTPDVQLNLTGEEVEALVSVLGLVSGHGPNRDVTDGILDSLAETLGFDSDDSATYPGELRPESRFGGFLTALA